MCGACLSCNVRHSKCKYPFHYSDTYIDKYEEKNGVKYTIEGKILKIGISWQESLSLAQDICKHPLCGLTAPTP